jgi:hypothetical protein
MLGIVLPIAVSVPSVATVHSVGVSIAIVDEVIVIVDGDVIVASPSAVITPASAPHRSHGHSNAE